MRIELRGTDTVDPDFQGHAGPGAIDCHRTGQRMSDVARQVSRDIVSGLAEPGLLLDRAPTRVQSLKRNHVARVDRQRGCQLAGKISVQRPRCRVQVMPCHVCLALPIDQSRRTNELRRSYRGCNATRYLRAVPTAPSNIRFLGYSGREMLAVRLSHFEPERTRPHGPSTLAGVSLVIMSEARA